MSGEWTVVSQVDPSASVDERLKKPFSGNLSLTQTDANVSGTFSDHGVTSSPVTGTVEGTLLRLKVGPLPAPLGISVTVTSDLSMQADASAGSGPAHFTLTQGTRTLELDGTASITKKP